MEREPWNRLVAAIREVGSTFPDNPRVRHSTATVVMVHAFSTFFGRPVSWACHRRHWVGWKRPSSLPDQSTMSRRVATPQFTLFQRLVGERLNQMDPTRGGDASPPLLRVVDGKPLEVPRHSTDRQSAIGRGAGGPARGYKLHAIWSGRPMPEAFTVTPLNVCEKRMLRRMLGRLDPSATGYLLADALYDQSPLHDLCVHHGHVLLCPRIKPGTGLGHGYQSPHRLRVMQMLEPPPHGSSFGKELYKKRSQIEREFGNATSFGGGLTAPPAWVRRIRRVRPWVTAKLLINAARIVELRRRREEVAA